MKKNNKKPGVLVAHRLFTQSHGGGKSATKRNSVKLPEEFHKNLRFLFGNLTPDQTFQFIEEVWMNGHKKIDRSLLLKLRLRIEGLDKEAILDIASSMETKKQLTKFKLIPHKKGNGSMMLPRAYHNAWRQSFGHMGPREVKILLKKIFGSRKRTWTWPEIKRLKAEITAGVYKN